MHTTEAGVSPPTDFTTFMRNYQDMVYSTAARLTGNDAQAEDIAQEVFLKAYENYGHLSTSPTAGGWLKTVATNLSLNHLSRYRKRWRFFSEFRRDDAGGEGDAPEVEFAAPDTFFSGVDADDRRALVEQALAQLPQHQRVPLVLYHFEDLPYEEIARKLGVSLAKVKTDILRARRARENPSAWRNRARENHRLIPPMSSPLDPNEALERQIHATLRSLPPRRAPGTLETRVLAELERRAALPWWRQSFVHWPMLARAGFIVVSLVLMRFALLLGAWVMAGFEGTPFREAFAPQLAWYEKGLTVVHAIGGFFDIMHRNIPPVWLYGGLAFIAAMYATLLGLGAAAYKALHARR